MVVAASVASAAPVGETMNRRERRAAASRGEDDDRGEKHERTCVRMAEHLRAWLAAHPGRIPRFAMPPEKVAVFACLDHVIDVIARDDNARELAEEFCRIGIEVGGPNAQPTILMLWAVLNRVGVPTETAELKEFEGGGRQMKVIARGSRAEN
jgi:hypothetical protein